jgi:ribosomal protein S1
LTDFGIFVEVSEGVEGLVHISEIDTEIPKEKLQQFYPVNAQIRARVIKVDLEERRLGLSIIEVTEPPPGFETSDEEQDDNISTDSSSEEDIENVSEKDILSNEIEGFGAEDVAKDSQKSTIKDTKATKDVVSKTDSEVDEDDGSF